MLLTKPRHAVLADDRPDTSSLSLQARGTTAEGELKGESRSLRLGRLNDAVDGLPEEHDEVVEGRQLEGRVECENIATSGRVDQMQG